MAQLYLQALDSLYVVSYDSQGYGGGNLTLPLPGGTHLRIYILQEQDGPLQNQNQIRKSEVKVSLRQMASQSVCLGNYSYDQIRRNK
jgi:hypothetical protein